MLTYTTAYKRAADIIGISTSTSSQALTNIQQDINQGLRIFKNASRRYWTRKEVTTTLVASQQYYTFPEDMVRITTVRVTNGGLTLPVVMIDSEEMWNRLNVIPAMTVGIPTTGYIRGKNELGLYPIPSVTTANGLIVSYESRLKDMSLDDTSTITLNVTNGSVTVAANTGTFNSKMVGMSLQVTDGSDGNWYPIVGYTNSTTITLENVYQGPTSTGVASLIGQVPDIPEDYQLGLVYFAAYNYYLKRKDAGMAANYKALYQDLLTQYIEVYADKTTGQVLQGIDDMQYSLFGLPPMNMTSQ
jgi:hypothetical protein